MDGRTAIQRNLNKPEKCTDFLECNKSKHKDVHL